MLNNYNFQNTVISLSKNYHNHKNLNFILKNFNLLYIFFNSYKNFINIKLKKIFSSIFPIFLYKTKNIIDLISYKIIYPKKNFYYTLNKGLTYSVSVSIKFFFYNYAFKDNLKKKILRNKIFEENLIIPNIPLITDNSTFIIDGIEKVIVSKFVRSPGIYFYSDFKFKKKNKQYLKIVPDDGDEINFVLDFKNLLYLEYKNKKLFLTDILKSFGFNNCDIVNCFYNFIDILFFDNLFKIKFDKNNFLNYSFPFDIINNSNEVVVKKNKIIDINDLNNIKFNNINYIISNKEFFLKKYLGCDLYYKNIKIAGISEIIDSNILNKILKYKINNFKIIIFNNDFHFSVINTLKYSNSDYFISLKNLNNFLNFCKFKIFDFNILNYNSDYIKKPFSISFICRKKINFFLKKNFNSKLLSLIDIINFIKILISFKDRNLKKNNFLSLNNLILHNSGEILSSLFFDFFFKLKQKIKNSFLDFENYNLNHFFKIYNLLKKIKNFFTTSKYCQYLDQLNILSDISHKRKVTFLGVIGVSKKYSGFDSRDLDSSHYSKLCPVETSEGINIGLVNSLALLCRVDKYCFLISPYYKVKNNKIYKNWNYLPIDNEFNSFIMESTNYFKDFNNLSSVISKYGDSLISINPKLINYINILPYQILSFSACLIPFLENNDSNRALMATNMLKQALPLLHPSKPVVLTGLESLVSYNSRASTKCFNKSVLYYKNSNFIILKSFFNFKNFYYFNNDIYFLFKYISTNQKTIKSQKNFFFSNIFYKNDLIIDNNNTNEGHLSLGQNLFGAFIPWKGYNFEDSIVISEKLLIDEKYTSLEFLNIDINVLKVSDKFEILTDDVLKKNSDLNNLNKYGIINNGSKVYGGDILVGKMCPIIDDFTEINKEQRLLYSIFSNKSEFNYFDTSFYLPMKFGSGTVFSSEVYFSNIYKDLEKSDKNLFKYQCKKFLFLKKKKYILIKNKIKNMIINFLLNKKIYYKNNLKNLKYKFLKKKNIKYIMSLKLFNKYHFNMFEKIKKKIYFFLKIYNFLKKNIKYKFFKDLPINVTKIVKISLIIKKRLQVGDKMSGRHGNKGVISKILPVNEMPYLFNGKILEIILNPLGVPSRMNIGQLLEIHIGFISLCISWKLFSFLFQNNSFIKIKNLLLKIYGINFYNLHLYSLNYYEIINLLNFFKNGFYFSVPSFSGFNENYLNNLIKIIFSDNFLFDLGVSYNKKQTILYDGKTGKKFKNPSTVGLIYILKLNHLAEDKIHSRSVGPYSMITQQPLRGKSSKGGQRLGEMEVWAIEAYGAFYSLQEMFTIKSDDVNGRFLSYKNIVKGIMDLNLINSPQTFDVMLKNINSLSLYIRFNEY